MCLCFFFSSSFVFHYVYNFLLGYQVGLTRLQCVVVCCSVLQCVTVSCSVLQCVAVCCSVLQCVAVCCSVLRVSCEVCLLSGVDKMSKIARSFLQRALQK